MKVSGGLCVSFNRVIQGTSGLYSITLRFEMAACIKAQKVKQKHKKATVSLHLLLPSSCSPSLPLLLLLIYLFFFALLRI